MRFFTKRENPKPQKKKSVLKEWIDSFLFAVIAATVIRWLLIEAFTIPTASMEQSLLVGDYLFVSKIHYGARTPITPFQIPLTHQKIWKTDIASYLDWLELPQFRLPALSKIKNNDVVVFNYPPSDDCPECPLDLKTHYIKRCVAIAGDDLEIRNRQLFINGKLLENPVTAQSSFIVSVAAEKRLNTKEVFLKNNITDFKQMGNYKGKYIINTTSKNVEMLRGISIIDDVMEISYQEGIQSEQVFPKSKYFNWSLDYFGKLHIPAKEEEISIDSLSLALYGTIISDYEDNENVVIHNNKLFVDDEEITKYRFKQDYFFMLGDNRHNSTDSRSWGFVPKNHVVGKALFIWWSTAPKSSKNDISIFSRIRWNRLFLSIE